MAAPPKSDSRCGYQIRFAARKTLAITVYPDFSIKIDAPNGTPREEIEARLRKRGRWVVRQILHFQQFRPRLPKRRYVGGETHLYLGRQYRLKLIKDASEGVKLKVPRGLLTGSKKFPTRQATGL
jgi:predicted metal-dependent hydrolase